MNKRSFIKSLGTLAVGCLMATGLNWKPEKITLKSSRKIEINPEWANAKYEVRFIMAPGAKFLNEDWPVRSNNPNAMRDKDFIAPFIEVDA